MPRVCVAFTINLGRKIMRGLFLSISLLALGGCAFLPVKSQTLTDGKGGSVTCHETGRGVVSYWVGKAAFDRCVTKAENDGYDVPHANPNTSSPAKSTKPWCSPWSTINPCPSN
jgi:hypothetical protein